MGKVRPPEEVAARKAKKEAKKEAKRANKEADVKKIIQQCAASKAAAAGEGTSLKPQDYGFTPWSLSARLNPKRSCFDATLKAAWPRLSKEMKKNLENEDKLARAQFKKVVVTKPPEFPFPATPSDHYETSPQAFHHIVPLLKLLAKRLGKEIDALQIYDPYFCSGAAKRHLHDLGFTRVYNECVDFYAAIENGTVPEHDIVVSNPPFSKIAEGEPDHIARVLRFCVEGGRPFLLHMPEHVTSASYYAPSFSGDPPLLLAPYRRYQFWVPPAFRQDLHQSGHWNPVLGLRTSPFTALWYVCLEPVVSNATLMKRAAKGSLSGMEVAAGEGVTAPKDSQESQQLRLAQRCRLCRSLEQLPPSRRYIGRKAAKVAERPEEELEEQEGQDRDQEELAQKEGQVEAREASSTARAPGKRRKAPKEHQKLQEEEPVSQPPNTQEEGLEEPPSQSRAKQGQAAKGKEVEGVEEEEAERKRKPRKRLRAKRVAERGEDDGDAGKRLVRSGKRPRVKLHQVNASNLEVAGFKV